MIWAILPRGRVAHLVPFPGRKRARCGIGYAGTPRVDVNMRQCKACMAKQIALANAPRIW